jgi:branched-chain amino acid transport system substrate-binding protein
MKQTVYIIIALVLIVGGFVLLTNKQEKVTDPIVIGYIGPLTGPSAVLGMDAITALQIGVDEANEEGGINGREIKLVSQDDQYLVKNTVSAYEKIVGTDKAKIVLVATYGGFLALKDQAKDDGVVLINPLDCNKALADASKNLLCLATETESIGEVIAEQMVANGQMNAGVMYSTKDVFMSLVTAALSDKYGKAGGTVSVESFNYEDKDFKTQLLKLKEKNIDALVLLGHDETGVIMKQARDLGMTVQFYTTGTITSPGAQQAAAGNAEGTIFAFWDADPTSAVSKSFIEKFMVTAGRPPILPLTTHPAYDTIKILTDVVLPEVSDDIDSDEVVDELLDVQGYDGITGEVNFNENGGAPIKESAYKLVNGAPVKI